MSANILTPDAERIVLGDGRKAQIRRIGPDLVVTYGRGPDSELFRAPAFDLPAARRVVTEWAGSLKPAPSGAVTSPMAKAERIADLVARLRLARQEVEATEAEIAELMGVAL